MRLATALPLPNQVRQVTRIVLSTILRLGLSTILLSKLIYVKS
jgi:hypothetical protein